MPVLQCEDQLAIGVPTTGLLPGFGRKDDRHADLLRPGSVHLLPNDLLDPVHHAKTHRKGGVDAGRDLPYESAAQEKAVGGDLGLRRVLAQGAAEQGSQMHGH